MPPVSALSRRVGFTLVEMLVVVCIIAVLAGLLMPSLQSAMNSARMTICVNNQRNILQADRLYADDYRGLVNSFGNFISGSTQMIWWMWLGGGYRNSSAYLTGGYFDLPSKYLQDYSQFYCPAQNPPSAQYPGYAVYGKLYCGAGGSYLLGGQECGEWMTYVGTNFGKTYQYFRLAGIRSPSRVPLYSDTVTAAGAQWYYFNPKYYNLHLRHNAGANLGFADGHVGLLNLPQLKELGVTAGFDPGLAQIDF